MTKKCFVMCLLIGLSTAGKTSAQAQGEQRPGSMLNPLDYASLGAFPTGPGTYQFNTSGVPTLTGPGVRIEGIVVDLIAVFAFDDIRIPPEMVVNAVGSRPLALLSHRSVTVEGPISVWSGQSLLGIGGDSFYPLGGGGGGGFGGAGGDGFSFDLPSASGGAPYGDILVALQGGSRGGAGRTWGDPEPYGGGQGGGALELGAVGAISVRGPGIHADGQSMYYPPEICIGDYWVVGNGGGSGGGILVHADSVVVESRLSASGGNGSYGCHVAGDGGGGGGGRIAVAVGSGGFLNTGKIVVAGGFPGGHAGRIVTSVGPSVSFTVDAHTFADGGQGCWPGPFECGGGYYDETPGNWGDAQVRPGTDVDLWYDDGGIVIGGLDGLEWLTFPVNVPQSGTYTVTFRTASPADRPYGSGVVNVGVYGVVGSWIGNQTVPVTGGAGEWHTYVTWQAPTTVYLPAGAQTLTMWAAGGWYNVRSIRFTLIGSSP